MDKDAKLGEFLGTVSNWDWQEFWLAERDESYTTNQSLIFALIRACAMQRMDAIKLSLNRLDGKLKTPIIIEYPKIYYRYPNADPLYLATPEAQMVLEAPIVTELAVVPTSSDLPSLSLRETLSKMSDYSRSLPKAIVDRALEVEMACRGQGEMPDEIPRVKSVVAAHLLLLAQNRNIDALSEVFDAVDGKLAETIQILGDDIFITSYLAKPPPGAYLNKEGIVEAEALIAQNLWANKLGREATGK